MSDEKYFEYFAVFNTDTGEYQGKGMGQKGVAQSQDPGAGLGIVEMPFSAYQGLPENLEPLKQAVIDLINLNAGIFRKKYITDIPGQQATYLEKLKDAEAWIAAGSPSDLTDYPYIRCESEATGQSASEVASTIVSVASQWKTSDAKIEGKRRGAAVSILAATNIKDIVEEAQFSWEDVINS